MVPVHPNYHRCAACVGRPVAIRTRDGRVHRGIIAGVNRSHVIMRPLPGPRRNLGGFGLGYRRYGGFRPGFGWGIALGAIATLAVLPWFY